MDTLRLGQQNTMLDMVRQIRQMDQTLDRITSADVPNYEEGIFSPTVRGSGMPGTGTYSVQNGRYTRIGRLVHFELYVNWTNLTGATGTLAIGGLPFTSSNTLTYPAVAIAEPNNITLKANNVLVAWVQNNNTYILLIQYPVGGGTVDTVALDTAGYIMLQGVYSV